MAILKRALLILLCAAIVSVVAIICVKKRKENG